MSSVRAWASATNFPSSSATSAAHQLSLGKGNDATRVDLYTHNRPRRKSETPSPAPVRLCVVGEAPCGQAGGASGHHGIARHSLLGADMMDDRLSQVGLSQVGVVHHECMTGHYRLACM
jgi:hypothetical protein